MAFCIYRNFFWRNLGTLLMSVYAKMPLAQAPGMGLNAFLAMIWGGGVGAYSYFHSYSRGYNVNSWCLFT